MGYIRNCPGLPQQEHGPLVLPDTIECDELHRLWHIEQTTKNAPVDAGSDADAGAGVGKCIAIPAAAPKP